MSLYQERLDRIRAAVVFEPVDKIPFSYLGTAVNVQFTGGDLARYCQDMDYNYKINLKGIELAGEVDSTQNVVFRPDMLSACWLSEVALPGQDLPKDDIWQIREKEKVMQQDYDIILERSFDKWYRGFLKNRLGNPMKHVPAYALAIWKAEKAFAKAGIPTINRGGFYSPFEMFCGGRSLMPFLTEDLLEIPDKVELVFQEAHKYNMGFFKKQLKNPLGKPIGIWIGCWRGTPAMLSPGMFERFAWKYVREIVDLTIDNGVIPILHLDSCWDKGLNYLLQLPQGKCIAAFDGSTDIFKAKKVLGNHICIMGDVPASMIAFGKPDEVSAYCKKLIRELGPTGFILSSGCDIPYNARLENVRAMISSVHG